MAFLTEHDPPRLVAVPVHPGVRRMVAPNPGPMTYTGTNTWLVDGEDGLTVIDPGPDDAAHIAAIAALGPVARIVLTHTHPDHLAGAPALRALTGAPIACFAVPWAVDFVPDLRLADGARIGGMTVLHTPGHASDHLCLALDGGCVLFTGDHVMSWSTSIVSPPDGDMGAYMAGLRRLLARDDALYLCGHGPPLPDPAPLVRAMLSHRAGREAAILALLAQGVSTPDALVGAMYAGLAAHLRPAARRTVLAHLGKLVREGRVRGATGEAYEPAHDQAARPGRL
jgi:glyoxylase-like metal-dependent hydrolase (beta-lactamase superfamily II)